MKRLNNIFRQYPVHCLLLPVFFILHNYAQYYGLVSAAVACRVLSVIELVFLLAFLLLWAAYRHINRAALALAITGIIYLFYGVAKDFLAGIPAGGFLSRYSVLLPLVLIITVAALVLIRRKNHFGRSNLFLNLLFILFIVGDAAMLFRTQSSFFLRKNLLVKQDRLSPARLPAPAARPDVYFLVFDSYPGTGFLHDFLRYDNTSFDRALQNRGFYVAGRPKSNYNRTALSIAATLNMEYLQDITHGTRIRSRHYNKAGLSIAHAIVPAAFIHNGYTINNLSIFDIGGQPPLLRETFLTLPQSDVLLHNTLATRIKADILWNYYIGKHATIDPERVKASKEESAAGNIQKRDFNNQVADSLLSMQPASGRPVFTYAHLYLPHPPFFYDKNGHGYTMDFDRMYTTMQSRELFLSYLAYTNKIILKITDSLQARSGGRAVIIVQSDHGYRDFTAEKQMPRLLYENYSAFYFPDRNYSMLYDSISNINTFPVLFNKYFNTHIALQPDTAVILSY